ncbi:Dynein heavy chain 10, axonemal [Rhizoctonia solani]|uniref:Dynein heavy chain 10, axonemal n=1 Tax=Rhizoctonia solani TaxID=456999 RepID=A0A0K6GEN9_9AGAM|nr:Dynein heavy chain 10, axonemal [Rhizoctonia solani]
MSTTNARVRIVTRDQLRESRLKAEVGVFGQVVERLDLVEFAVPTVSQLVHRIARMYSEQVRLCLNSLALRADLDGKVVAKCLDKALNSAMAIIQMQHDSATTDGEMSYSIDYLTIVLATAAVFLIRLTKLSTHLAKTVRDMARVAGLTDAFPHTENSPERTQGDEHANELDKIPLGSTFEALLAFQNQTDPSYLELLFGSTLIGSFVELPGPRNIQLINFPHELLSEITKQLDPLDLIHLVRVNKFFRRLFLDRSTVGIWRTTLANVGLPPCPDDSWSEPSYAALMFLKQCTECGEPAGRHADPIFLVRLCSKCRKEMAMEAPTDDITIRLIVPRSQFLVPSKGNRRPYWSMRDQYEEIKEELYELRRIRASDLRVFIDKRKNAVQNWEKTTMPLVKWVENREKEYKMELNRLESDRRTEVEARLRKLGWEQADVQLCFYHSPETEPLLYKAKLLDDKDWSIMLPYLLAGLETARENRLRMEVNCRRSDQEDMINGWLDSLPDRFGGMKLTFCQEESTESMNFGPIDILCARRRQQGTEKMSTTLALSLPTNQYVLKWPPVQELLNQDKSSEEFQPYFISKQDDLKGQLCGWRVNLEAALVKTLPEGFKPVATQNSRYNLEVYTHPKRPARDDISTDLRTLLRADAIFKHDHKPVYYPNRTAFTSWTIDAQTPVFDPISSAVAKAILNALHHPDASYLEMRALGPSFVCGRCTQDPSYLTWEEIVAHFVYEYERWKSASRWNEQYREQGGGITLVNTHDLDGSSKPLVHLVAEEDRAITSDAPKAKCKVCESIGQYYWTGLQHIAKHVQATHLIESPVQGTHYT